MKKLKAGVIGLGVMGSLHARIYSELKMLHGIYDLDENNINKIKNLYKINICDLDTLLKEVDLVTIAVPTVAHLDIAKKCFEAKVHVLLEKPICSIPLEAEILLKYADNSDKLLAVGYIERFNPSVLALLDLVKNNFFGKITSINIKRVGGIPRSADNIILDLMTHDIDILRLIFNRNPEKIYTHYLKHDDILDSAQSLLDFGDASGVCESNWISPIKIRRVEITGTEGLAIVDLMKQTVTKIKSDMEVTQKYYGEPLKNEILEFINAIETNNLSKIVTGKDALETLKITMEVFTSKKENR